MTKRIPVPPEAVRTREQILAGELVRGSIVWRTCWNCGGSGNYPSTATPAGRCRLYCWHGRNAETYGKLPIAIDEFVKKAQASDRADYRAAVRAREAHAAATARLAALDPRLLPLVETFALDLTPDAEEPEPGHAATARSLVMQWAFAGDLSEKQWTLAAELPARHREAIARAEAEAARKAATRYVGTPGERIERDVRIERVSSFPDAYRPGLNRYVVRMSTIPDGDALVWFTGWPGEAVEEGATLRVRATVKKQDLYEGERQTTVLRVAVVPSTKEATR